MLILFLLSNFVLHLDALATSKAVNYKRGVAAKRNADGSRALAWMDRKSLVDLVGPDTLEDMIKDELLVMKSDPKKPLRNVYALTPKADALGGGSPEAEESQIKHAKAQADGSSSRWLRFAIISLLIGGFYTLGLRWDIGANGPTGKQQQAALGEDRYRSPESAGVEVSRCIGDLAPQATTQLPTIWPMFTKLRSTSEYVLQELPVDMPVWSTELQNISGIPQLSLRMTQGSGGERMLEASSVSSLPMLLASVCENSLVFRGLGGNLVGNLRRDGSSELGGSVMSLLDAEGVVLASLSGEGEGGVLEMRRPEGRLLASLKKRQAGNGFHLVVQPGVDIVLAVMVIVAARCFQGEARRRCLSDPTAGSTGSGHGH
eukprot:TRINITY_DN57305_c0_g1_i1.p1 TRINITY_DN57305_c0_g1~~TRINITY_DN57305_c0_g1_i1.p1  ORF type:complete len:403 (+),score=79.73 TRINITY_DN57305_c0_g1_i1:88-1209(+)